MALYRLYPPAEEGTALKAKFCPALGTFVFDSILVQAPNLKSMSWPSSCLILMLPADMSVILPFPEMAFDGFKHVKSPLKLRSWLKAPGTTKGYPNVEVHMGEKMSTLCK